MLTPKQIKEIREHLDRAGNPIFFFDNDPDGLCSFLLLQRYVEKGKGVPIKSFPEMDVSYYRKVEELNADYIFILDKPLVSKAFLEEAHAHNLPIVWIDHHEVQAEIPDYVHYYNPIKKEKTVPISNPPVTYLCYQVISEERKRNDLWIAIIGCVADKFIPDFYKDFEEKFPDLSISTDDAFDIYYGSRIGKIARIISFALKDRTTNVITMIKFLIVVKTPYEVLEESSRNFTMHSRYKQIDKKYQKLLQKSDEIAKSSKNLLFFQYGGDLSISSDLANELSFRYKGKIIVVVYITGIKANISARGKNVKESVLKSISGLENASGGGHDDAVGAQIKIEDIEKFRESLSKLVG
ncbi:hypothetical protein COU57_01250 [Candidatus Pacearchaeota archaeon CG10_big_fil_rev_8_21_14_0_10_32_14]|nr:MAG: hypothetical protein COU57_01250 [Candidatus Pacearchaeota archaeon CG10_big_fil_rev_8_21_14_0_10_32_14]